MQNEKVVIAKRTGCYVLRINNKTKKIQYKWRTWKQMALSGTKPTQVIMDEYSNESVKLSHISNDPYFY